LPVDCRAPARASRAESSGRIFHASQALIAAKQKTNLFAAIIIASPQKNTYV
jgi:hypothetical protein